MALDGNTTTFLPYTLNGLQELSANSQIVNTLQVNSLTPNRVVVSDGSDFLTSAGASSTEVDYLIGTTSNVQTQLNTKASTTYVDTANNAQDVVIATKASTTYVDTANNAQDVVIATKASTTYVDNANNAQDVVIATKASTTYVDTANNAQDLVIATKAATTYVDAQDAFRVLKAGDTMSGNLVMGANIITSTTTPSTADTLTRKGYVDTQDALRVPYTGATANLVMGSNKVQSTATPTVDDDLVRKGYGDATYLTSASLAGYLPLTGGNLTGNLTTNPGVIVNFGNAIETNTVDLGYSQSSFTTAAPLPTGLVGGTITGAGSSWRLTALTSQATMAMRISGIVFLPYVTFKYVFTGMAGNVNLSLTVRQADIANTISNTPITNSITTTPQTITGFLTTTNNGGTFAFNFQASVANPYVNWTGFTITRVDTRINGEVRLGNIRAIGAIRSESIIASRALTTNSIGVLTESTTTATELGYLSGTTSSVQTQLNAKANTTALASYLPLAGGTLTGNLGINQSNPQWKLHINNTNAWSSSGAYSKADGIMALGGKDDNADFQYLLFPNPSRADNSVPGMFWWSADMITGRYRNEFRLAWFKETHGGSLGNAYKEGITLFLTDSGGFTNLNYIKLNGNTSITGNVGIGTTAPSGRLDVRDGTGGAVYTPTFQVLGRTDFDGSNITNLQCQASQFGRNILYMSGRLEGGNDAWTRETPRNGIIFRTQATLNSAYTHRWTIQNFSNQLGFLNPTNGNNPLLVLGDTSVSIAGALAVSGTSNFGNIMLKGCTSDTQNLIIFTNTSGLGRGQVRGVNSTSIAYDTTSDRRLKDDVHPIENALGIVQQLNPVHYRWKNDDQYDFGFIAQEVYKVLPHMRPMMDMKACTCTQREVWVGILCAYCRTMNDEPVDDEGKPKYYSLDYSRFTPYIVGAVQEQQGQIQVLQQRNEILEKHARQIETEFNDYRDLTDRRLTQLAELVKDLLKEKPKTY